MCQECLNAQKEFYLEEQCLLFRSVIPQTKRGEDMKNHLES